MPEPVEVLRPLDVSTLTPALNITHVVDGAGLEKLAKCVTRLSGDTTPMVGLDAETNCVVDFFWRRVRTIQVGDKNEQFVIDLLPFAGSEETLTESQGHYGSRNSNIYKPIFDILSPVLCSNMFLKVGQNLPFEYEVLHWNFGQRIWNLYSIDLAERVIKAGAMSLKNYPYFSLEQMIGRYFKLQIDKSSQTTFDLKTPLTETQIVYGALDIRMPIAIRGMQLPVLKKDGLEAVVQIENDALGSYTDMHITGQALDKARWVARVRRTEAKRVEDLKELDSYFLPIVGNKHEAIDETELNRLESIWKNDFEVASPAEMEKAAAARKEKDPARKEALQAERRALENLRKEKKACARANYMVLSKKRTVAKRLIEKCEGEALINYNSGKQLLEFFHHKKIGLTKLKTTTDDDLLVYNDRPMIQCLRRFKKGKKDTGTYGEQWTQTWTTKPCADQGWLHPGDGRLHCTFNQLEAETGRSSSSKPNAQNLPQETDIRSCFICDPPNENIRISVCCEEEATLMPGPYVGNAYVCPKCNLPCDTKAEEYVIVTVDMAGAELRIIADMANDPQWVLAFNMGWDLHSVGTELLYPEKWPTHTIKSALNPEYWTLDTPERLPVEVKGKIKMIPPCAYFARDSKGELARQKCECPGHKKLRDGNKSTNFLLCYGGGPSALADALDISLDDARELYALHESKNKGIWDYLKYLGKSAMMKREARDMFGRRRLFPEPTWEDARLWFMEEHADRLEYDDEVQERQIMAFKKKELREPDDEEKWVLTHRYPTTKEISSAYKGLFASIERRGKNMPIQGTNASIIKRSLGCGFDKDGRGYLWHLLPQYKARLQNMVHDELVAHCPKRFAEVVARTIADAFKRAAGEVLQRVRMEADWHITTCWSK